LVLSADGARAGCSATTQYSAAETAAAADQAQRDGIWLNAHARSSEAVKLAARSPFRTIYHCAHADEEALDLLESVKDTVFVSPAPGLLHANAHDSPAELEPDGAERVRSVATLAAMATLYPQMRARGIRVLPGGDYGFPNNPIGRNARDLALFVDVLGYTPLEALTAATGLGGHLMGMGAELGVVAPGYLADLLVVRGDPTRDVRLLQRPENLEYIVKGGSFHKRPARAGRPTSTGGIAGAG
jgi:imidazolonepropionase-like amidohydrolase